MATKVKIKNMRTRGVTGSLRAFFAIELGPLHIEDLRLLDGQHGLFVGMPSKKIKRSDGTEGWVDLVKFSRDSNGDLTPTANQLRNSILNEAVAEFERRTGETIGALATTETEAEDTDDLPF